MQVADVQHLHVNRHSSFFFLLFVHVEEFLVYVSLIDREIVGGRLVIARLVQNQGANLIVA